MIYFKSVTFQQTLQVYKVSVLPNFQCFFEKRQGTSSLTQTFADLLSIGSNQSLLKIKIRCERPTGELCCVFERHKKCSFPERAWNIFLSITV